MAEWKSSSDAAWGRNGSSVKVTFAAEQIKLDLVKPMQAAMTEVGRTYANTVKTLMRSSPATGRLYGRHRASSPGEPPAPDTGRLVNSIEVRVIEPKWGFFLAEVGTRVKYALYLEHGAARGSVAARSRKNGQWSKTGGDQRIRVVRWILYPRPAWGPAMTIVRPKVAGIVAKHLKGKR